MRLISFGLLLSGLHVPAYGEDAMNTILYALLASSIFSLSSLLMAYGLALVLRSRLLVPQECPEKPPCAECLKKAFEEASS